MYMFPFRSTVHLSQTIHRPINTTMIDEYPTYGPLLGAMGATAAMIFSTTGAAYGIAKSGTGLAAVSAKNPELIMKCIIPVVMAGMIGVYGVVVTVLLVSQLKPPSEGYTLYK